MSLDMHTPPCSSLVCRYSAGRPAVARHARRGGRRRPARAGACLGGSLRRGSVAKKNGTATCRPRPCRPACANGSASSSRGTTGGKATRKGGCRCGSSAPRSATRRARPRRNPSAPAAFEQACGMHAVPLPSVSHGAGLGRFGRKSSKKKVSFVPCRERAARAGAPLRARHAARPVRRFRWRMRRAAQARPPPGPTARRAPSRGGKTYLSFAYHRLLEANRRKAARGRLLQLQRVRQVPHLDEGPRRRSAPSVRKPVAKGAARCPACGRPLPLPPGAVSPGPAASGAESFRQAGGLPREGGRIRQAGGLPRHGERARHAGKGPAGAAGADSTGAPAAGAQLGETQPAR